MNITDIMDPYELGVALADGYVRVREHPEHDLRIYNYTDKAQFDQRWDNVTMNCRGLITDGSGKIVARGMPKFFNLGQPGAPEFDAEDIVDVSDKLDGSLGICYQAPDGDWWVATRGSFESDQALHASELLNANLEAALPVLTANGDHTVLVEIIYPDNRVVLDYFGADAIPMLGVVDNDSGKFYPVRSPMWPWGHTDFFGIATFGEAVAVKPRENAEGLVLTRLSDSAMVKIKQDDYLRLHKAIFGLSSRKIWQLFIDGEDVDAFIAALPDEFQQWAKDKAMELELQADVTIGWLHDRYMDMIEHLDAVHGVNGWEKKDFALEVKDLDESWALFALHDGKDIEAAVWKRMRPEAFDTPVRPRTEEVA